MSTTVPPTLKMLAPYVPDFVETPIPILPKTVPDDWKKETAHVKASYMGKRTAGSRNGANWTVECEFSGPVELTFYKTQTILQIMRDFHAPSWEHLKGTKLKAYFYPFDQQKRALYGFARQL